MRYSRLKFDERDPVERPSWLGQRTELYKGYEFRGR